jgi:hypothetical protein
MVAHGRGLAGSDELAAVRPYWLTLWASVAQGEHKAPEKENSKKLEEHGHANGGAPVSNVQGGRWRTQQMCPYLCAIGPTKRWRR